MEIYRKKTIPTIFTQLDFIRDSSTGIFYDAPEHKETLLDFQRIASGLDCVSVQEFPHELIIKYVFPDDLLELEGHTGRSLPWKFYYWNAYDVETLVKPRTVRGSVPLSKAGIDPSFVRSLADGSSCIKMLLAAERYLTRRNGKGYELSETMKYEISQIEGRMISSAF